jgi:hypothetical protein
MPMNSDEHAEMLMRQNNCRLSRSLLVRNIILGVILLGIGYFVYSIIVQNASDSRGALFLMVTVVLVASIALSRLFFRLPGKRSFDLDQDALNTSANEVNLISA